MAGWTVLAGALVLFVLVRIPAIGHLLVWDEAMNLCSVRAIAGGAPDTFTKWFWHHPPLFCMLTLPLKPLATGFAERVEILCILINVLNAFLLYLLNRRVFGRTAALWSIVIFALLPGSVFFSTWIKRDHLVVTFGLAALLLLRDRRSLWAGLALGLALLSKESGIFYVLAALALWGCGIPGGRSAKDLAALAVLPVAISAGWYVFAAARSPLPGVSTYGILEHIQFAMDKNVGWPGPWYFYLAGLPLNLGWLGIVLGVSGFGVIGASVLGQRRSAKDTAATMWHAWPVALLLPSLLLLSVLHSKVAWIVIGLIPAWATLAAVAIRAGAGACLKAAGDRKGAGIAVRAALVIVAAVFVGLGVYRVAARDYEDVLKATDDNQWRGATYSRDAAQALQETVSEGERVLVSSFHYWKGVPPGQPCAVFEYYRPRGVPILLRPHTQSYAQLLEDIRTFRIDWALLSPELERLQAVCGPFVDEHGLAPRRLQRAILFRTSDLYRAPDEE